MAKRIRDRRTGKICNYETLADEVRARMQREGIPWRRAAEKLATEIDDQQTDSIVRNLNRYKDRSPDVSDRPHPPRREVGLLPGLAMLYRNIEEKLKLIDQEIEKSFPQSDEFYEIHAQRLKKIRALLEALLERTVSEREPALRMLEGLVGDLGEKDYVFDPAIVYDGELELVKVLIDRARRLQNEVATARPNPSWEEF